jgi:hypothetical protein
MIQVGGIPLGWLADTLDLALKTTQRTERMETPEVDLAKGGVGSSLQRAKG